MMTAILVYTLYASQKGFESTIFNYFAYLADAFNHGQFHLRLNPQNLHDLVIFNGWVYLYWFPMPAILMMPLVAIFGVSLSDVLLTILFGGLNAYLFTVLLHQAKLRQIHHLDSLKQALLVIFFSFGTVHFTLTPYGKVWQLSQLISIAFMLLAYLSAISLRGWKAFLLTGIALAGAMLTRSHLILVGIWPAYYLIQTHLEKRPKKLIGLLAGAGLPIILGAIFILFYNQTRFGNPFELGLHYHQVADFFAEDFKKFGTFNLAYVPKNLYYNFLYYPIPSPSGEWMMGGSLFLLSPVFFAVFFGFYTKKRVPSQVVLVITILLVYLPSLLLMGTGWVTYGPRYTLDFVVPFLLLTAQGVEKWPRRILAILCLISVLHYSVGTFLLRWV
jgi:hypothetical protein